jgi:polysaccharide export outer membrane protein
LPAYVIEPPDILGVEYAGPAGDPVKIVGQRLVRPDGTVGLGQLGSVAVAGRTIAEARAAIAKHLAGRLDGFDAAKLTVDVVAYNSKVFYVLAEGEDGGEQVYRLQATGSETVLDALAQGKVSLVGLGRKRISLRRKCDGEADKELPVDWKGITEQGDTATNYQLRPGDRIHIKSGAPKKAEGPRPD